VTLSDLTFIYGYYLEYGGFFSVYKEKTNNNSEQMFHLFQDNLNLINMLKSFYFSAN